MTNTRVSLVTPVGVFTLAASIGMVFALFHELQNQSTTLRTQTQLEPPQHPHSTLQREEPLYDA